MSLGAEWRIQKMSLSQETLARYPWKRFAKDYVINANKYGWNLRGNGIPLACSKLGGVAGIFIFYLLSFRSQVESYHV